MKYHDAFCMYNCNAPMFHSSFRWWDNLWEGDTDEPALCCGHAWTIQRAEAEFWLGLSNKDAKRIIGSYNSFLSNFAKQDEEGNMYVIYQCEPCISGSTMKSSEISRRFAIGFPNKKDTTFSRYAYARAYGTWFACSAVIGDDEKTLLNAKFTDGVLHSDVPFFKMLYIENITKDITVFSKNEIEIFCKQKFNCLKGKVVKNTDFGIVVKPDANGIFTLTNEEF